MLQLQLDLIIIKWERYWDWLLFPIYYGAMWSNKNSREVDKKMLAPNLLRSNFMMSNFEQVIINILANLARRENFSLWRLSLLWWTKSNIKYTFTIFIQSYNNNHKTERRSAASWTNRSSRVGHTMFNDFVIFVQIAMWVIEHFRVIVIKVMAGF